MMKPLGTILLIAVVFQLKAQTATNVNSSTPFEIRQNALRAQLQLTPHEDSVFFPVYKLYFESISEIRSQNPGLMTRAMNLDSLSDEKVTAMLNLQLSLAQSEANLKQEYFPKFLTLLPPKKVARLYQLEKVNTQNMKLVNSPKQDIPETK